MSNIRLRTRLGLLMSSCQVPNGSMRHGNQLRAIFENSAWHDHFSYIDCRYHGRSQVSAMRRIQRKRRCERLSAVRLSHELSFPKHRQRQALVHCYLPIIYPSARRKVLLLTNTVNKSENRTFFDASNCWPRYGTPHLLSSTSTISEP